MNPIKKLPLWLRKMAYDALASFVAALIVMSLAQMTEAGFNAVFVAAGTALGKAGIRYAPDFLAWVRSLLGLED
jgi:hypothetical protein